MRRGLLLVSALLLLFSAAPAQAEDVKNKGLFVTPVREFIKTEPGAPAQKSVTIANNTDHATVVTMNVEQFKVTDFTYDYKFETIKEDWVKLSQTQVNLEPGESQKITYTVSPPADATPGGHYFTVFATATVQDGAVKSQVRAATTIYVTISGQLSLSSAVQNISIPQFAFGGDITFAMDVKNTGNTHFFVYVAGELKGLTAQGKGPEVTHLLLPDATRTVGSTIGAPLLPGLYSATYGYKTESGEVVERTSRVIYVPIWSWLIIGGLIWLVVVVIKYVRRRQILKGFGPRPYK